LELKIGEFQTKAKLFGFQKMEIIDTLNPSINHLGWVLNHEQLQQLSTRQPLQ